MSGEIAEDLTSYYAASEQTPTVCALGVLVDKGTGEALLSGGLLIQALPGADDAALARLEENVGKLESGDHHAGQGHDGGGDLPQGAGWL